MGKKETQRAKSTSATLSRGKKTINKARTTGGGGRRVLDSGGDDNHPKKSSSTNNSSTMMRNPGHIGNRLKRSEMYGKYLQKLKIQKNEKRRQRVKETVGLGEDQDEGDNNQSEENEQKRKNNNNNMPKTIDNMRYMEPTLVINNDPEIMMDEMDDEFTPYFMQSIQPKVMITTRPLPSQNLFYFIADLQKLIPQLHFYPRKSYSIKEICQFGINQNFTHLIVLSEKSKVCNGMTISHLRSHDSMIGMVGPTAFFKLTNVVTGKNIPHHGAPTSHIPELNLHGFHTRLGHRIGRLLGSLFPIQHAEFRGRQVVTFHNQRDYIFVRQHRYIFEEKKDIIATTTNKKSKSAANTTTTDNTLAATATTNIPIKTRLQELGPRFTLKLRWLQEGTFDTKHGEYEWIHKRKEMDISRRRFHL